MAFKTIWLSLLCFFASNTADTAEQNSDEVCSLHPDKEYLSSEFQLLASEKGVRIIYINVEIIRNYSYHPRNVSDQPFLPVNWVYTRTTSESMLFLPYGYHILSLGLLNHQTRSMNVVLKENPIGCIAALNSSCQNRVIGKALITNITTSNQKGISLHKEDAVCVQVRKDSNGFFKILYNVDNLEYRCCVRNEFCDKRPQSTLWFEAIIVVIFIVECVVTFCSPAIFLVLPDSIFSFEEELKKDKQEEEQEQRNELRELAADHEEQEPLIFGLNEHGGSERSPPNADSPRRRDYGSFDDRDHQQRHLQNQQQGSAENDQQTPSQTTASELHHELVYMDDASPITYSTFFKRYIFSRYARVLQHLEFSFIIKLTSLVFGVLPIFVAVTLLLALINRGKSPPYIDPLLASFHGSQLFSLFFCIGTLTKIIVLASLFGALFFPLILHSRAQDFCLRGNWRCFICREYLTTMGTHMHTHVKKWQISLKTSVIWIVEEHSNVITKAMERYSVKWAWVKRPYIRPKRAINACVVMLAISVFVLFRGAILGVGGLVFFMVWLVFVSFMHSPLVCVIIFMYYSILQFSVTLLERHKHPWDLICDVLTGNKHWQDFYMFYSSHGCCKATLKILVPCFIAFFCIVLLLLLSVWLVIPCFLVVLSVRFLVRLFGLTIIGIVLNKEIVTPFVAFLVASSANLWLCYRNLQNTYKEIKKIISKYRLKHRPLNCSIDTSEEDSFPEDLFWHVIDDPGKVLPLIPEFYRMIGKMVIIIAILFFALCSAISFNDSHDFGAIASTIYFFITGAIAGLVFRGLSIGKKFTGKRKKDMMKSVEVAVVSFYGPRPEVVVRIYTHV